MDVILNDTQRLNFLENILRNEWVSIQNSNMAEDEDVEFTIFTRYTQDLDGKDLRKMIDKIYKTVNKQNNP